MTTRTASFRAIAVGCVLAAGYHLAGALGALGALPANDSPAIRHLAFVAIDLSAAWYVLRRPLALLPVFVVFVMQQTMGHGVRAVRWWQSGAIDWISLGTLGVLYAALILLTLDARDRSPLIRRIVCPFPTT